MTTTLRPASVRAAQGPERSPRRDLLHLAILMVPWALFGWLWWRVVVTTSGMRLLSAVGLVLLVAAVCVPATSLWVLHNVRIFRRKGPRTGAAAAPFAYHADWTSRPVVADWDAVRAAQVVVVDVASHRKRFLSDESTDHHQLLTDDPSAAPFSTPSPETAPPEGPQTSETDEPREPAPAGAGR